MQVKNTNNKIECDSCGNIVRKNEVRYLNLKTCCSVQKVPLCPKCWEEHKQKG